jgi:cyclohexadieny/prephenate dehydrogenase
MPDRLRPPLATPLFGRIALIGIGLIGSSIARATRHLNLARVIVAIDRDEGVVARVRELGIADEATADPAAGVTDADLVILCVPVGVCGAVAEAMRPGLKPAASCRTWAR